MVKNVKRLFSVLLAGCICLPVCLMSACFKDDSDVGLGNNEYTGKELVLEVGVFNGGYGYGWLRDAADEFERMVANTAYGENMGIQIRLNPDRDTGSTIYSNYALLTNDMYFTEQMSNFRKFVDADYLVDITDVVTENVASQGHSIESVLHQGLSDIYSVQGNDGTAHYYGLPFSNGYMAFTYDEELFYNQGLLLVKDYDDNGNEGQIRDEYLITPVKTNEVNANGNFAEIETISGQNYYKTVKGDILSMGPDGKYGTYDDGQASTYKEFFALCDFMMNETSVKPFVIGGSNIFNSYSNWLLNQLAADDAGYEQTVLNYSYNGTLTKVIGNVDDNGNITYADDVQLVPNNANGNAKYIAKTEDKYNALKFFFEMNKGNKQYFHSEAKKISTQYAGQTAFMLSKKNSEKAAFLMDGIWWEGETTSYGNYEEMAIYGAEYKKENRRFKLYSLPKASKAKRGATTIVDTAYQAAFILKKTSAIKQEACKQFLQYCFTDDANAKYTAVTGAPRPYNYTLTPEQYNSLSSFAKSVWDKQKASSIVYPISNAAHFVENSLDLTPPQLFRTRIGSINYDSISLVVAETGKYTLKQAFDGLYQFKLNRGV